MYELDDIQVLPFPSVQDEGHILAVYESDDRVPFSIQRAFSIAVSEPCLRGQHAHRTCTQLLICLSGRCFVHCKDGHTHRNIHLTNPTQGLIIPPGIWASQHYYETPAVLLVLCDHSYDESDYIRNYGHFLQYRKRA